MSETTQRNFFFLLLSSFHRRYEIWSIQEAAAVAVRSPFAQSLCPEAATAATTGDQFYYILAIGHAACAVIVAAADMFVKTTADRFGDASLPPSFCNPQDGAKHMNHLLRSCL